MICGGVYTWEDLDRNCYSFENGIWEQNMALTEVRIFSAIAPSPFELESHRLFITGGKANDSIIYVDTSEIYTVNGWEKLEPSMPKPMYGHCMVAINSSSTFLIGGFQNTTIASEETFIFNSRCQFHQHCTCVFLYEHRFL